MNNKYLYVLCVLLSPWISARDFYAEAEQVFQTSIKLTMKDVTDGNPGAATCVHSTSPDKISYLDAVELRKRVDPVLIQFVTLQVRPLESFGAIRFYLEESSTQELEGKYDKYTVTLRSNESNSRVWVLRLVEQLAEGVTRTSLCWWNKPAEI